MYLFTLRQEKKLAEIFTFLKMQLETRQFAVAEKFSRELNPSGHCTNGIAAQRLCGGGRAQRGRFFGSVEKKSRFDLNCPRTGSNCFQKPFVCRNTEGKNSNILVGELLELLMQGKY